MRRTVIIGGVAGGATVATKLRRLDESAEIIVLERGAHVSFANCGLPYYIGDEIKSESKILLQSPQSLKERYELYVRVNSEVVAVSPASKSVKYKNLLTGEFIDLPYDNLVVAVGSKPIIPEVPGLDAATNLFTLRNVVDANKIKQHIAEQHSKSVTIIGAAFVGLELAENLVKLGMRVRMIDLQPQILPQFDLEMVNPLNQVLIDAGVELILGNSVAELTNNGKTAKLTDGTIIEQDLLIMAIGVRPETSFLANSGIVLNEKGAIVVNEYLQTNYPEIYAVGDAVVVNHLVTNTPTTIPLAWPANRQAVLVAENIIGNKIKYNGSLGTAIVGLFARAAAITGLSEIQAKRIGLDYKVVHIHPYSHATYYPGAEQLHMKMLFSEAGNILGAQVVGKSTVDKQIDIIATAIKSGMTVFDLADLELAYAPQFSSAKHPVNMLGYTAANVLTKQVETVQWYDINKARESRIIDVREPSEYAESHIEGAENIPLGSLRSQLNNLSQAATYIVYCRVGLRGYLAARILQQHGYRVKNLDGGMLTFVGSSREQ